MRLMRVSRLMLATLRDIPADAEITSHQLLLRGGFIKRVASGIYAYMPLMWRVLQKITSIVQQEMNAAGCLQTLLPQLHPSELWKESGRWQGYTAGEGIMFNLKDRQGKELGLGPTHEEVITSIAREIISSYKQLPVSFYQIQTKFRDEIRPRFGLMRSREFIMKDAYSFHRTEKDLKEKYNKMDEAYKRIFEGCGLNTVAVEADSGAIGGGASQEFMILADSGEDSILTSQDGLYSANLEKAISIPKKPLELDGKDTYIIQTTNQKSIEEVCSNNKLDPSQILKVVAMLAITQEGKIQPLLLTIRGDQDINETKLTNAIETELKQNILSLKQITKDGLISQGLSSNWPFGSLAPDLSDDLLINAKTWERNFLRLVDNSAAELKSFVCGSNSIDKHRKFMDWEKLGGLPKKVDIRNSKAGDSCVHDPDQKLLERRGIEIGHIFQLGKKYSNALNATFTNEQGIEESFWMGCYGIGISRLAQAAVEQHHDESGIVWPIEIAPFEVIVVIANINDSNQQKLGEKIYQELIKEGVDTLLDDRPERAGVKFKDADLIGIPWRVVVGRDAASDKVELVNRANKQTSILSSQAAKDALYRDISNKS